MRDLLDMYLLVHGGLDTNRVVDALRAVFARRRTHEVPASLPPPPSNWTRPFAALAEECAIEVDIQSAFNKVATFAGKATPHAAGTGTIQAPVKETALAFSGKI